MVSHDLSGCKYYSMNNLRMRKSSIASEHSISQFNSDDKLWKQGEIVSVYHT